MERNYIESAKQFNSSPYEKIENPPFPNQPIPNNAYPQQNLNYPPPNANQDYAVDVNKLKRQQSSIHCQALIATLLLIGGQVTGLVLYFYTDVQLSVGALLGICVGSYVLYLIVACCCNPLSQYLGHISRGQLFQRQYESLRNAKGHFVLHAVCYHYEIRHHTRTVRDSKGHTRHQHYTTRQKVITHTATQFLNPISTKDQSGAIDQIRAAKNIVFIHYFVNYRFADPHSQMNFNSYFTNFKFRHTRDVEQDFSYKYEVPGLVERKAYFIGELSCNFNAWYYFFGAIGLIWPYSLCVQSKINRFRVDTMKVLVI